MKQQLIKQSSSYSSVTKAVHQKYCCSLPPVQKKKTQKTPEIHQTIALLENKECTREPLVSLSVVFFYVQADWSHNNQSTVDKRLPKVHPQGHLCLHIPTLVPFFLLFDPKLSNKPNLIKGISVRSSWFIQMGTKAIEKKSISAKVQRKYALKNETLLSLFSLPWWKTSLGLCKPFWALVRDWFEVPVCVLDEKRKRVLWMSGLRSSCKISRGFSVNLQMRVHIWLNIWGVVDGINHTQTGAKSSRNHFRMKTPAAGSPLDNPLAQRWAN